MRAEAAYSRGRRYWIWALMSLSIVFSARYLYWRIGYTLNYDALWFSIPLLAAEYHSFVETAFYFFMVSNPKRRKSPSPLVNRSVDVFVSTYNEPLEILRMTLRGCRDLRYPHTTYVCDDGNRPEVKALAEEFGCEYITRPDRKHAKAGNLNNALKHSSGEFIVTLDADYMPMPTFIDETLGFFADEKVAFVQLPQDFYNLDSFEHLTLQNKYYSWHEQELFHSVIQPGKDRWNAAFYCGSPAILRRKALEDVEGFATGSVTEDLHTSIRMHSRGWRSVFYNKTLAWGLAPSTANAYSKQRERWGMGSMQILKSSDSPLFTEGLQLSQRISYFASMFTYFLGFQKLIFILTPIVLLLTGVLPILTEPQTFAKYFFPYFLVTVYAMSLTQGRIIGMVNIEKYNLMKFPTNIASVLKGLLGNPQFRVTPKGKDEGRRFWDVAPHLVLVVLSFAAAAAGLYNILSGRAVQTWLHVVAVLWAAYFIAFLVPIAYTALRKHESRKLYRFDGRHDVVTSYNLDDTAPAGVYNGEGFARNITPHGFSITTDERFEPGSVINVELRLPDGTCVGQKGVVRRVKELRISKDKFKYMNGVEFKDLPEHEADKIAKFLLEVAATRQADYLRLSSGTRIRD